MRPFQRNPGKVRHLPSLQKINLRYNLMQHLWRHFTTPLVVLYVLKAMKVITL